MSVLRIEREGELATVTLNRPEAMNALSSELCEALAGGFEQLAGAGEARVVILTGTGRAFSAGVDLKELGSATQTGGIGSSIEMIATIRDFPGPVIAAVNGFAITGGFELALAADFIVASRSARFADTHARVGILPGWGLSQKLPRLIGIGRAKELAFTGNYLTADEALAWGLVNRVTEPDALLPTCRALAEDMLSCVPEALRGYKRVIDEGFAGTYRDGLAQEARASIEHMQTVRPESLAERRAAVQRRGRDQSDS
jgi:enoyl-CoA hydratase